MLHLIFAIILGAESPKNIDRMVIESERRQMCTAKVRVRRDQLIETIASISRSEKFLKNKFIISYIDFKNGQFLELAADCKEKQDSDFFSGVIDGKNIKFDDDEFYSYEWGDIYELYSSNTFVELGRGNPYVKVGKGCVIEINSRNYLGRNFDYFRLGKFGISIVDYSISELNGQPRVYIHIAYQCEAADKISDIVARVIDNGIVN